MVARRSLAYSLRGDGIGIPDRTDFHSVGCLVYFPMIIGSRIR